jgi:two-component system, sensor histidine kinase
MGWPSPLGNSLDREARGRLRSTQTSALLAHTSVASVISTLAALVLAMYLAPTVGAVAAYTWFVLKLAVALPRAGMGHARIRRIWHSDVTKLNRAVLASLTIDGAVWGLAGVWCVGLHSEAIAGLLLGCLSSIAVLATFGLQVQQTATAAYVVPIMLPLGIALAARGDVLGVTGAGGALLILIQTLVTGFASERRVTREFIAQEQLRTALHERSAALKLASETSTNLQEALFEVQRQSSVKALFLGTMSHELRTPLHGILGLTELALTKVEDQDVRKKLNLVTSSAEHLLELIGALLEVSRIDAGKLVLHEAPFDIAKELRTMAELYAIRAHSKGIGFEVRMPLPKSLWVHGDAGRLRQILHNLLGNAIKFTKRGLVTLNVEERDRMFVFEIIDTGTGISAEDLPHIFEAFRQTRATAPRTEDGTGLGLTIARELARAMGGDISVTSAVGVGSRFMFGASLNRVAATDVPERVGPTPLPILKQRFRVLLVEDNEVNAMIAQAHLDRYGIVTIRARDGKEAVAEAFGENRPDLILMDYRMPLMDGPAACREIRAVEDERLLARVPIIALTASPSEDDQRECMRAGMDGFLAKPFTADELVEAIRAAQEEQRIRLRDHPLYEFALSLDDTDGDIVCRDGNTIH